MKCCLYRRMLGWYKNEFDGSTLKSIEIEYVHGTSYTWLGWMLVWDSLFVLFALPEKKPELNEEGLKMKSQLLSEERFLYDNLLQHQQLYFIAAKM